MASLKFRCTYKPLHTPHPWHEWPFNDIITEDIRWLQTHCFKEKTLTILVRRCRTFYKQTIHVKFQQNKPNVHFRLDCNLLYIYNESAETLFDHNKLITNLSNSPSGIEIKKVGKLVKIDDKEAKELRKTQPVYIETTDSGELILETSIEETDEFSIWLLALEKQQYARGNPDYHLFRYPWERP